MIRYQKITPRQAYKMILDGRSEKLYVEDNNQRMVCVLESEFDVNELLFVNWFVRIDSYKDLIFGANT